MSWWKKALQPRILVPVLISAGALVAVFSLSNIGLVWDYISTLTIPIMAFVFGFVIVYLIAKGVQFYYLLRKTQIRATRKQTALAFMIGEAAVPIPAGVYLANYVLGKIGDYDVARSTAATTATLLSEILVSLVALLILVPPGWWWLRPAIGVLLVLSFMVVASFARIRQLQDLANWILELGPLRYIHEGLLDALEGMEDLFSLDVAIRVLPLTAFYLATVIAGFWVVGQGIGISRLTFPDAVSIYLFSIAVTELLPVSANLGVVELSGVGAAQAWGYSYSEGLAVFLATRLVWDGSVWLLTIVAVLLLRDEFTRNRRRREREARESRAGRDRAA